MGNHPKNIIGFDGSIEDAARAVANLHHDSRRIFFETLTGEILNEQKRDTQNNHPQLAAHLLDLKECLQKATDVSKKIWNISKRYMP